jgi:hypothetical protein
MPHEGKLSLQVFRSPNSFIDHLRREHETTFTESHLSFLVARAKRPSLFPFTECPFCRVPEFDLSHVENVYKITGTEYEYLSKEIQLQKHIGNHIQNFSLYAFLQTNGEDDDWGSQVMATGMSGSRLESVELDFEDEPSERTAEVIETSVPELVPELDSEIQWDHVPTAILILPLDEDPVLKGFVERAIVWEQEAERNKLRFQFYFSWDL